MPPLSTSSAGQQPSSNRWVICAMLFTATTINYLDRQVLSLLAPDLQRTLGWGEKDYAHIVTAFQASYALALVAAGHLIDRFGVRLGYSVSVGMWSLAAIGHALVSSAFGFGVMRALLGAFEAGNFPAAIKAVAERFPRHERALANGIFNTGSVAGAIIAPLSVPWMAAAWGWQATFVVIGVLGFIWILFWWPIYRGSQVVADANDKPEAEVGEPLSIRQLLGKRATWALIVARLCSDPIWWFFLFWLAKFLDRTYGLKLTEMSLPLVAIYGLAALGSVAGGWAPRQLLLRGVGLRTARLGTMLICALAVVPVTLAVREVGLWTAVMLIGIAMAAHCAWISNTFALVSDLFPRRSVATVAGLSGMVGSLGGMVMAQVAGQVLESTGSYLPLFLIASASYLCGWIIIRFLLPRLENNGPPDPASPL
jgi:ACS family hexuronate transporter-like MFS transporter